MDAELIAFLFVGSSLLFAILAMAKDRDGRRYGAKRMAHLWWATLPYFLSSAFEFSMKHNDGSTERVKITYATWFLLALPVAMVHHNVRRKREAANKAPEPTTTAVTPRAP